ncbi:MAG: hypothetical protein K0S23_420 [Fluviicola sp.]|jgi:hypothetical protein|uniref:hypothetical protein n=1 Tax=Fluviicola sp. TaxID=1917219 RepID=UPI00260CB5DC|nr:hypothetical protein [Fluviicola sp.]MDF3026113.1 hypothetical protein [Fluviicola sp.]
MSVINELASSLNRRDEIPNQELAAKIASSKNKQAVAELIEGLQSKSKDIQNDCIKVLYEIGVIDPKLIADFAPVFLDLLKHKNNRLQWGGMTALDTIALENPEFIYESIPLILDAVSKGSVITMDGAVNIFIKLCGIPEFSENAFVVLIELIQKSPTNQLPMYAERAMPIVTSENKMRFVMVLSSRLNEIEKESKRKRVEKVVQKVQK